MAETAKIFVPSKYFSEGYYRKGKGSSYVEGYEYNDKKRIWKPFIETIKKYNASNRFSSGCFLDIGCAYGYLIKYLRQEKIFREYYGLDVSEFAISQARRIIPAAHLQIADINSDTLPYPDNFFDIITSIDVLEHTLSIEQSVKKIVPKLRNDGYLIIALPIRDTWASKLYHLIDRDKSHISIPSRAELFGIIRKAGLKIVEKEYFFNTPIGATRLFPAGIKLVLQKDF